MVKAAPAPSLPRQIRASRSTARSLVIVAISLCLCLAVVAAFAALHTGTVQNPELNKPPADWLEDRIKETSAIETDTTWGKGALAQPAEHEAEALAGVTVDFDVVVPEKLPEGFRLESATGWRSSRPTAAFPGAANSTPNPADMPSQSSDSARPRW
jgi:hypothetical protein